MTTADSTDSERNWSSLGYGAVSAAAWGFGFLILRVFAVSGYHWDTAFAVGTVLSLNIAVPIVFGDARCVDGQFSQLVATTSYGRDLGVAGDRAPVTPTAAPAPRGADTVGAPGPRSARPAARSRDT